MRKILALSFLFFSVVNFAFAQELVLSDRIREAREAARKEAAKAKLNSELKPVSEVLKTEKTACDKTNQSSSKLEIKK